MSGKRAHIWAAGRVALAAVLLFLVFKYVIPIHDTVKLADGTVITGTFVEQGAEAVVIEADEDVYTVPYDEMALGDDGRPAISRGFIPLLKEMRPQRYAAGMILLGLIPWIASLRWITLMHAQGMPLGYWRGLELTYLGLFCNNFMPGLTGGDVAKAYYASKMTSRRKTNAVVTVFLDRLIGMITLACVAGVAVAATIAFPGGERSADYMTAAWLVGVFVLVSAAGIAGFFSSRVRALGRRVIRATPGRARLRSNRVVARVVGLIGKIDAAIFLYRDRKAALARCVLLSVAAHSSAVVAIYFFGKALGVAEVRLISCFVVVPVAFIVSSIPIAPAGWGIGEVAFKTFFGAVGVGAAAAVTISIVYRLTQALWTLPGGLMLMVQKERPTFEEVEEEMEEAVEMLEEEIVEDFDGP